MHTVDKLNIKQVKKHYKELWFLLTKQQKNKFKSILFLLVFSSLLEILSLGSLLPFIAAIVSPETIFTNEYTKPIVDILEWKTAREIQINLTIIYISIVLMAAVFKVWINVSEVKLVYSIGNMISCNIYKSYLLKPYSEYVKSNSSEILSDLTHKVGELISNWLIPTVHLIVSTVLLVVTIVTLLWINPVLMFSTFTIFAIIYLITVFQFKESVHKNTEIVSLSAEKIIKEIQEASGNIRDIMLHERQEQYSYQYNMLESTLRESQAQIQILSFMPKTIIETLGILFIAILALLLTSISTSVSQMATGLGLLVVGVQKILPLLNQIFNGYISLKVGIKVGGKLLSRNNFSKIIRVDDQAKCSLHFESHLILKDVSFNYSSQGDIILNKVNLRIKKNSCIGIIGRSGSGKSTMSDILLGMLTPTSGSIYVDDVLLSRENIKMWRNRVAHVPQSVYLLDDTILKNITNSSDIKNVDDEKLGHALSLASLMEFIEDQDEGFMSKVGERGMRLSGGQRQRIGIARAIYEGAEFLVFDEPTSALDPETEKSIMKAISELIGKLTILIVSHNINSLKMCNEIIKIESGLIIKQ